MEAASASTHKRTSSAAGNAAEGSESKRRMEEPPNPGLEKSLPSQVYIVVVTYVPQYGEQGDDIRGVYSTIDDANNCVRGIANDYTNAEDCRQWSEDDGRANWTSNDVGEGERVEIRIQIHDVKAAGSEPSREWATGVREGDSEGDSCEDEGCDEDEEDWTLASGVN